MRGYGILGATRAARRAVVGGVVAMAVALPAFAPTAKAAAPDARRVLAPVTVKRVATPVPTKLIFGHKLH
jgi:hypothetical protein